MSELMYFTLWGKPSACEILNLQILLLVEELLFIN